MDAFLQSIGLSMDELIQLIVIAVAALIGLAILRIMFRLTATLLRMGCAVIVIGMAVLFFLNVFN